MKVYELMEKLSGANAGAEIVLSKVMTLEEIAKNESMEEMSKDEKTVYDVGGKVSGVYTEGEKTVLLYAE